MGRLSGALLTALGIALWYYGGSSGSQSIVNLGIGSIILGIVAFSLPGWRCMPLGARTILTRGTCAFFKNLVEDLELKGRVFAVPPYENLPWGGIFIPFSEKGKPNLGRLSEGRVLVSEPEPGVLIYPIPGQGLLDELGLNEVSGMGADYASSALSGVLGRLGLPGVKVFEEESTIEAYVSTDCGEFPYADPVVSALLVALAASVGEVLTVENLEYVRGYLKLTLRKAGGVEKWL